MSEPGPRRRGDRPSARRAPPRSAGARPGTAPAAGPGRCGRSSSASATAWSATCRWSWASPAPPSGNPSFILLAGIAGLLAGAFSMAAGEYISMQSQRELFERQIALERAEMEAMPEEEEAELAASYRAKGFTARRGGPDRPPHLRRTRSRPRHARPRGARPRPRRARVAVGRGGRLVRRVRHRRHHPGHPVPVRRRARRSSLVSLGLSLVALFAVGAAVSLLTGRGLLFSGFRQLGIGLAAALVTYVDRLDHRRHARGLSRPMPDDVAPPAARRGPRPAAWSNGPGDRYARPRPRLRQGHRRRARVDPVRPAGDRRRASTWTPATASSCRPGRRHDALVGPAAWPASRRTARPAR